MAIGDPKTQSKMDKEIAALRRQHRAGKLTDFKLRQGIKKIKEKYGKAKPSTVSKVMSFLKKTPAEAGLFTPSPRSAKGRTAAKKLKSNIRDAGTKRSIQEVISRSEKAAKKKADPLKGLDLSKGNKSTKTYRIKKGDTLSAIAARNDTTVAELKKLNNIKDVNKIIAGKSLKLPKRSMRMPKPKPKGKK